MAGEAQIGILTKEPLLPDRTVNVGALRTSLSFNTEGVTGDHISISVREVLNKHPETDFLVGPEYLLFKNPKKAAAVKFTESHNLYEPTDGDPEVIQTIQQLSELAKSSKTALCAGTISEVKTIENVSVLHNTAILIDSQGKIVQLRRKFTGSDAITFADERFNTHDFYWQDENEKYRSQIYIPDRNFKPLTSEERIMARAIWSAVDSEKPVTLFSKNNEKYSVLVGVCAESHDERFYRNARNSNVDILALIAREGDAHYTDQSQVQLFGEVNEGSLTKQMLEWQKEGQKAWQNPLESHREWVEKYVKNKQWWFQRNMDYAKNAGTISPHGIWLTSDAAGEQVGIFPASRRDSVVNVIFTQNYLVAHCTV